MTSYNDEDQVQRCQFVKNIPYMRNLDAFNISKIVFLLREQVYDYGETILGSFQSSDCMMIVWQGLVQVRVVRLDVETGEREDLWLDTLEKGACLSVYNAFNPSWTSLLTFKASEKNTIMLKLKASDLEDLSKNNY